MQDPPTRNDAMHEAEDTQEETIQSREVSTGRWVLPDSKPIPLPGDALSHPNPLNLLRPDQLVIPNNFDKLPPRLSPDEAGATANHPYDPTRFELAFPPFEIQCKTYITTRKRIPCDDNEEQEDQEPDNNTTTFSTSRSALSEQDTGSTAAMTSSKACQAEPGPGSSKVQSRCKPCPMSTRTSSSSSSAWRKNIATPNVPRVKTITKTKIITRVRRIHVVKLKGALPLEERSQQPRKSRGD